MNNTILMFIGSLVFLFVFAIIANIVLYKYDGTHDLK